MVEEIEQAGTRDSIVSEKVHRNEIPANADTWKHFWQE